MSEPLRLVIVGKVTPGLNAVLRRHPQARKRDRAEWAALLLYAMRRHGKSPDECKATGKRRVTIERYERGQGLDPDGLYGGAKDLLDAIVAHGLLVDDKPQFCELVMKQQKPPANAQKHIAITIEDL